MSARAALVAVVVAYLAVAAWYAAAIPFGQAPDESAHLLYVAHLAEQHRLPVFEAVGAGGYEFHQAPLYYALSLVGYWASPARPYLGVRLFNALLGVGVILFTWLLCRELFPERPWRALAAAGFVAFLPMHVALCASVTNDVLAEVILTAGLWLAVRRLRLGWSLGASLALGALVGLGMLTKTAALLLLPVGALAVLLWAVRERPIAWRRAAAGLAVMVAAAVVVGGWWLVRNQALYGDPLAARAFEAAFRDRPSPSAVMGQYGLSLFAYLLWVVGWTFASFWGVFGTMDVFMPTSVYIALAIFSTVVLAGLVMRLRGWRRFEGWQRQAMLTLGFAVLLVGVMFVRFNMSYFQAQARYLFPAIGVFAMGAAWGISALFPSRARPLAAFLPAAIALALALIALPVWLSPQVR